VAADGGRGAAEDRRAAALIQALREGRYGVQLQVPPALVVRNEREDFAELQDEATGVVHHLFFFPDLHMVFRADLEAALQRHARHMFIEAFLANGGEGPPRTDDASWSPLVEVEHLNVGGAPAMRTVHRMLYERGREMVMGHLLVPLRDGLFEIRVIALDQTTGFRESLILVQRQVAGFLPQKEYDDPAWDATFPQHSLSRVRAALRGAREQWQLQVTRARDPMPDGEITLARLGCGLVPPPGFVLMPSSGPLREQLQRTSFCGTDGLESFLIERLESRIPLAKLRRAAEETTRKYHDDVEQLELHVDERGSRVLVIAEGHGHRGRLRNALLWFLDGQSRPWSLALISTAAVPRDVLTEELERSARSFRLLG
jgi:hypothetical protein